MAELYTKKEIQGEIRTFREITKDFTDTKIVIPKFQRDYAQGRKGKEELRNNFLDDLFGVIENVDPKAPVRIYDFIYGQREKPNDQHADLNYFYPVDGQQRLTTVYLLLLYIGKRTLAEGIIQESDLEFLSKFSYETRDSSSQFCDMLFKTNAKEFANLPEYLDDHHKMTGAWVNDSTISGMKQMLKDIHNRFVALDSNCNYKLFWENATEKIAFWRLYIEGLKTIDDLYIKMNSRGKHLSDFENFKVEIDQLAQAYGKTNGEFQKEMDTTWTNLFWGYRDKDNDKIFPNYDNPKQKDFTDNGLDDKMLTFFRNYLTIAGVKSGALAKSATAETLSGIRLAKTVVPTVPNFFDDLETILHFLDSKTNNGTLLSFFEVFLTKVKEEDRYANNPADTTVKIYPHFDTEIDLLAEMMTKPNLSIKQKLIIEAFFCYILTVSANPNAVSVDQFKDRLRSLRNFMAYNYLHDDDDSHSGKMRENLLSVDELMKNGVQAIKGRDDQFTEGLKDHELDKLAWIANASASEAIAMKQIENYAVVQGILTPLKGTSSYSAKKFANFREIFGKDANYDFIYKVMIAIGPYYAHWSNNDGEAYNYAGPSLTRFRNVIFSIDNLKPLNNFEKLLTAPNVTTSALEAICDSLIQTAVNTKSYDWIYYMVKYPSMRWAPNGHYLKMKNCNYYTFMFRARTCYHNDNYDHWNVYNDALAVKLGIDSNVYVDKHGGAMTLPGANVLIDIVEDRINLHLQSDGNNFFIRISQSLGVDIVDRIEFAKNIADKLLDLAAQTISDSEDNEIKEYTSLTSDMLDERCGLELEKVIEFASGVEEIKDETVEA